MRVFVDSFSGPAAELKGSRRTADNVLRCLRDNPRISTWDMDIAWLRVAISNLEQQGKIKEDKTEPYPWHRFIVLQADER